MLNKKLLCRCEIKRISLLLPPKGWDYKLCHYIQIKIGLVHTFLTTPYAALAAHSTWDNLCECKFLVLEAEKIRSSVLDTGFLSVLS